MRIFKKKLKKEVWIFLSILIVLILIVNLNIGKKEKVDYLVTTKEILKKDKNKLEELQANINKDIIGYLTFENNGDKRELPVLYTDSEFYMNHDIYGKKDSAGSIFINSN